jgi:histidinol-phosphate aminotransferase
MPTTFSRRHFMGGLAASAGYFGTRTEGARAAGGQLAGAVVRQARPRLSLAEYKAVAKLAYNENPFGPSPSVVQAMVDAFVFGNRYEYPDGDILKEIAAHHSVPPDHVLLGAGSSEILQVAGRVFLRDGKKVVGVAPTYGAVYEYASGVRGDAIILPLRDDHTQDIDALIKATRANYRDVGLVYICTPNNPTGAIVTKQEIRRLLDGIPEDVPVLIDEAYHHYVEHPDYATSMPYVLDGRQVIVARTFSKIYALAGMRLGYGVAPKALIDRMRPHSSGSINALVKWAGVTALRDTATQAKTRATTLTLRKQTTTELETLGYRVIPSEANFFMVHVRRQVAPLIDAFRSRGVLVGRPFPPMLEHLRVSVGTPDEMQRFMTAFKDAVLTPRSTGV